MGIAALNGVVAGPIGVRPILVIPFDNGAWRDGDRDDVALAGIVVDDDVHLRHTGSVSMDDIERDAVERGVAVAGTVVAPVGVDFDRAADVGDDSLSASTSA
jgi:hypothetical protein